MKTQARRKVKADLRGEVAARIQTKAKVHKGRKKIETDNRTNINCTFFHNIMKNTLKPYKTTWNHHQKPPRFKQNPIAGISTAIASQAQDAVATNLHSRAMALVSNLLLPAASRQWLPRKASFVTWKDWRTKRVKAAKQLTLLFFGPIESEWWFMMSLWVCCGLVGPVLACFDVCESLLHGAFGCVGFESRGCLSHFQMLHKRFLGACCGFVERREPIARISEIRVHKNVWLPWLTKN